MVRCLLLTSDGSSCTVCLHLITTPHWTPNVKLSTKPPNIPASYSANLCCTKSWTCSSPGPSLFHYPHICVDTEETGGHKKLGYLCIKLESQLHMYKLSCSNKTKMEFRTSSRMSAQQDDLVLLFECICSSFIYWTRPHLPILCHISIFLWTQTKEEGGQEGHICHA